jgi:hypothetical protein
MVLGGFLWSQTNSSLWGQQKPDAAKADAGTAATEKPDADKPDASTEKSQEEELEIRYAEAYLKLMQATLSKYEGINRQGAGTIRPEVIQGLQESVREARDRVQMAKSDDEGDAIIYVSGAEAGLRSAEESLRNAQIANSRPGNAVSAAEMARLKAQVELANVRVARARHLASESPLSNVRYEIELLREHVQDLQLLVSLLRTRN